MADPTGGAGQGLGDALIAVASKVVPGVLGSAVALRWAPGDATFGQRLTAFAGGIAAAYYVAPALYEWTGMSARNLEGALSFLVGTFAMVVIGEVTSAMRELQLASIARDAIRKLLGIH